MGNIREEYKVTPKKQSEEKPKKSYDPTSYPFGAEEMLLEAELEELDRDER